MLQPELHNGNGERISAIEVLRIWVGIVRSAFNPSRRNVQDESADPAEKRYVGTRNAESLARKEGFLGQEFRG